jgi:histidinol-phosphate aminotransferase/imidazoleglycerol-phosphate dehydratase/histidinol-phosphatase
MTLLTRLARPEILALPPVDIAANADTAFGDDAIKLDANENPFPPLVPGDLAARLNRYPEPQPAALRRAMAALYGVAPGSLVVTRGADDAIDILVRTFCRPGQDAIAICPPTFSAYAQFAKVQGARVIEVPLGEDFAFDADAFTGALCAGRDVKLAFLCSPNNPTGDLITAADVLRTADALPDTIIVLDEAYLEFSESRSLAAEAARRDNLVVLRTLSKAYGLAGARIGCAIGTPALIELISRALPPYPLPSPSIQAALTSLSPSRRAVQEERIARIKGDRDAIAERLRASPLVKSVRNGGGNFLFLEVDDPAALAGRLNQLGIRLRFRPNAAPGGVRLTVGTEAENEAALRALNAPSSLSPSEERQARSAGEGQSRRAEVTRDTKETKIAVAVDLDSPTPRRIDTGIPYFDHMLDQVASHAGFSLILSCDGDLDIDSHHSLEDCALALGAAMRQALGDKAGIGRFGFSLPMDETEAHVLIDLAGRPFARFEGSFAAPQIGAYPTEMTPHIFRSFADSMGAAIHVRVAGENDHHKVEACFKAFGRALRPAIRREGTDLPSTKGVL